MRPSNTQVYPPRRQTTLNCAITALPFPSCPQHAFTTKRYPSGSHLLQLCPPSFKLSLYSTAPSQLYQTLTTLTMPNPTLISPPFQRCYT
ncbi:hypothetical protein CY34DRAFT_801794 [Suillus luteus UH-Slu-Lm8-n1]|uniref:Uncharacterized protein n=1 Tax=Suillus luteus UH-Slu-Lm8-n1 TaxID=930992 RepID=A0A0D0B5Z0_9AGAM|nr:hypothetical protein CY34DRAFT_801794 [Suillus luteus UH-Slu-Lm8-n1]